MQADTEQSPVSNQDEKIDKPRILLVEDDLITNEVVQFYLKNDFIVDVALSEEQASGHLNKNNYFAVLLDINLGRGGSGLNVLKKIRSSPGLEKLPVIAETAFALNGDADEFLSAGCNYYLSKPFIKPELLNLLQKIKEDVGK